MVTIRLFLEDMSSFLMKNNLSCKDIKKCSNDLFGILNSENMFVTNLPICWKNTKILGRFSSGLGKLRPAVVKIFFALHLVLGTKLDICGHDDLFLALPIRAALGFTELNVFVFS